MALTLQAWLHQEIKDQLDLGHSWLEEKNRAKAAANKPCANVDTKWHGLYHDNGSCIDIIVPFSPEHARVLVLKTHPLTITDGRHCTDTSLTTACRSDLRARYPDRAIAVGATWTVRKYTIRYTSYGPPCKKLRLILDAVDWVEIRQVKLRENIEALNRSNEIASTLQHIHNARARDDDRCLRSQPKEEEDPPDGDHTMAGADDPLDEPASMNTQMPFGTQMQHPIRSRTADDDISFIGVNRLEPVLAANTQRAELKPRSGRSADERRKQAQLLSLIRPKPPQPPARPHANSTPEPGRPRPHADFTPEPARPRPHADSTPQPGRPRERVATASPRTRGTLADRASRESIEEPVARAAQALQEEDKQANRESIEEPVARAAQALQEKEDKQANRESIEEPVARAAQAPQEKGDKGKKRMREPDAESPSAQSAKKASFSEHPPKRSNAGQDRFAAECSWMKGLNFNRAAATVPEDQTYILNKPESWSKPQPGQPNFPDPNVPISLFLVFSRMTDEKAALEGASSGSYHETSSASHLASSGSYHETLSASHLASSGSCHETSSGSYPANSAPRPTDEQDSESEDEAPTSPVSWHTSPTPEPPQRPTVSHQGLPPDSSLETLQDIADTEVSPRPAVRRNQSPDPTPPTPSHENEEHHPPSSPPAHLAAVDSDDDMELEISVPQALGEDLQSQPATHPAQEPVLPKLTSVVQVKETPHVKGKNGQQPVVTVCPPSQESTRHMENSSSASVVQGTYQDLSFSVVEETRLDALRKGKGDHQDDASADLQAQVHAAQAVPDDDAQDVSMFDMFVHEEPFLEPVLQDDGQKQASSLQTDTMQDVPAQPEPTPMSAQPPPKDPTSGQQTAPALTRTAITMPMQPERQPSRQPSDTPSHTKRKLETTPTKDHRRGLKPKRPKYAFGGHDPETLRRERKEALLRSENERQNSTTSAESRHGSVSNISVHQDLDTKMADPDAKECVKTQVEEVNAAAVGGMSPRHQSLYATPSPVLRPAVASRAVPARIESISIDQSGLDASAEQITGQAAPQESVAAQQEDARSRSESLLEAQPEPQVVPVSAPVPLPTPAPVPRPPPTTSPTSPGAPVSTEQVPPTAPDDSSASLTIYEKFKAAYPDYKANVKHFTNQCMQMEELDREDRMVPKWMWDDFIIRNRTDFADYARDCIDAGEEPMKYIRFYKDTIRDAIYKKGIIKTRPVLIRALQELGVQPLAANALKPQPPVQQLPSQQSTQPRARQSTDRRQPRQHLVEQSPRQSTQPSRQQSAPRQTQSPVPPPDEPEITPPKKKSSRKSLPFAVPSDAKSERVNGTAHVRHSLPASSSRAAPASTPAQTPSTRPASSTQQRSKSAFGDKLRQYATDLPASSLETGSGNEYRDWFKAHQATTATTGSKRVDKSKPWPRSLEVRPSIRDLPKRKIDVLEWKDEL